jgi:hypothetical protein
MIIKNNKSKPKIICQILSKESSESACFNSFKHIEHFLSFYETSKQRIYSNLSLLNNFNRNHENNLLKSKSTQMEK